MHRLHCCCVILGSLLLAACSPKSSPPPEPAAAASPPVSAESAFSALEHEYVTFFLLRFPVVATYLGGSAFDPSLADIDGRLRNYSAAALADEDAKLTEFRQKFAALPDKELSARRRIDRDVALAQIEFLLHQHQSRRYQQRALDSFIDEPFRGVDWQMQGMASTGQDTYGSAQEWQQVVARLRAVPVYFDMARQQLTAGLAARNTPDWRVLMQFGLRSAQADADYFGKTLPAIATKAIAGSERDALLRDLGTV